MAVITFPSTLYAKTLRWDRMDQDVTFRGPFGVQSMSQLAPLWKVAMTFDMQNESNAGAYQALLMKLDGTRNQLALWNLGRPTPRGTFTGASGTTTMAAAAVGATSLTLTNASYASKTLVAGDFIGVLEGSNTLTQQVVMVTDDATSNGSGVITVNIKPALRYAMTGGGSSTVTLQQPKALFRLQTNTQGWEYSTTVVDGMTLDLIEDVRP